MTGRRDLFEESMRLGHSAAWDQEWDRAIEFYRKGLAESPDDPVALTSLGLALLETGRLKEALAIYYRAAKVSARDPIPIEKCAEIFERLGQEADAVKQRESAADLYIRRKDVEKALDNWRHIARLVPDNLSARSRLALAYDRLGRNQDAVREYLNVASILQSAKKTDRAIEAGQRALALAPGDPEAVKYIGLLRRDMPLPTPAKPREVVGPLSLEEAETYLQGESEETIEDVSELADPEVTAQQQAMSLLAALLFDESGGPDASVMEDSPGAAELGETTGKVRRASRQPLVHRYLGEAIDLQTRGHKRRAVTLLERAVASGLKHPAAYYNLGLLLKEQSDLDGARKYLLQSIGHPELALGANLALGRIARQQDDLAESARFLVQALRLADSMSVDQSKSADLGRLYDSILASRSDGDREALSNIVENTLEFLSGPEWLMRIKQARQQLERKQRGAAVVPIAEMLAVGGSERVVQSLTDIDDLVRRNMPSAAMEAAMFAIQQAPGYLDLHLRMAELMMSMGRQQESLNKMAIVARTHELRGESVRAADVYARILDYAPVDVDARGRLIELLVAQDRVEEALDQYLDLAEMLRQMAQIDQARDTLAKAMELGRLSSLEPTKMRAILHQMADIDVARFNWRQALEVFGEIRELDPQDENARRQIVDMNLRLGKEAQAARELDSYLEYLVQAGRSADGLRLLEEMTREHPGKQALHRRLAEAYKAAGRKADAIAQYDALGEIQLDAGQVAEAVRTIRTIIGIGPPDIDGYRELLRNLESGDL